MPIMIAEPTTKIHARWYGVAMLYIPHCGCGWIGIDCCERGDAERQRDSHACEQNRQCCGFVTVPVVGCRPASSFQRRCKRNAQIFQQTCPSHLDTDFAVPFKPRPINV